MTVDSWMKGVESPLPVDDYFGARLSRKTTRTSRLRKTYKSGQLSALINEGEGQHSDTQQPGDNRTEDDADNEENSEADGTERMKEHMTPSFLSEAAKQRARHGATTIDTTGGGVPRPGRYHSRTNSSATVLLHFRKAEALSDSDDSSPVAYRRRGQRRMRSQQLGTQRPPASTPTTPPQQIIPSGRDSLPDLTDFGRSVDETALLSSSFTTRLGRNGTCDTNIHEAMNRLLLERMGTMEKTMKGMMEILQKERRGK